MFCTCMKNNGWTRIGETADANEQLWVCPKCKFPSEMVFRRVTGMRSPENAVAMLSLRSEPTGETFIRWSLTDSSKVMTQEFTPYPRKVGMKDTTPLLFQLWALLDEKTETIMVEPLGPSDNSVEAASREQARHQARGIAEALALIMPHFYDSSNAVVREALLRRKKRIAGEPHESPGLAEKIWDPMYNHDGTKRVMITDDKPGKKSATRKSAKKATLAPKPKASLSEAQVKTIKAAMDRGTMTLKLASGLFKVSEAEVERAISELE